MPDNFVDVVYECKIEHKRFRNYNKATSHAEHHTIEQWREAGEPRPIVGVIGGKAPRSGKQLPGILGGGDTSPGHIKLFGLVVFLPLLISGSIGTFVFELYGGVSGDPVIANADTFEHLNSQPLVYFGAGDLPNNLTNTDPQLPNLIGSTAYGSTEGNIFVNMWWYFWGYHAFQVSWNACGSSTIDWEPIYVYTNVLAGTIVAVAYRLHCGWILNTKLTTTSSSGFNGTQVVITFTSSYHIPCTCYPVTGTGKYIQSQSLPYNNDPNYSLNETQPGDPWVIYHQPKTLLNATVYSVAATAVSYLILYPIFAFLLPFIKRQWQKLK
jgi:hypothetical protein